MNKILLKYCLLFISICFVSSLSLFYVTDLKEPVFLEHYYELFVYDYEYIELSYITNHYDDRQLLDVTFPQLEDINVFVVPSEMQSYSGDTSGRYKVQTVRLRIMCESLEFEDDIILDNAEFLFSNGKSITRPIGKIVLLSGNMDKNVTLAETIMSSSSSTGISGFDARFLDDVSIKSLPFVLKAETDGILKIYVNNLSENDIPDFWQSKLEMASGEVFREIDLMPFTDNSRILDENSLPFMFQKDEHVLIVSEFTIADDDVRKYNRYYIHRRIYLENEQGEIDCMTLYNTNYQPYFSGTEIYEFLKYKGET